MAIAEDLAGQISCIADTDLSNIGVNQYTVVALRPAQNGKGDGQGRIACTTWEDGMQPLGILLNNPKQGGAATIYTFKGPQRARAATAWNGGDPLKVVEGGLLAKAADGDSVFAIARESAVPGDITGVILR